MTPVSMTPVADPAEELDSLVLARSVRHSQPSILQEVVARSAAPGILSLALGMPASELFPAADLAAASARLLSEAPDCLQYSMPSRQLKEQIVELMRGRQITCRVEQVFLCGGAQQGMDLIARLLLDPGGTVMYEKKVYEGLSVVLRPLQPRVIAISSDPATGPDPDEIEARLAGGARPAFLYLIPEGHNPLGGSISLDKRRRLIDIARRWRLPILEDDAYGFLTYETTSRPPLRSLDERWVLYLGSFSKILAPGLRSGWLIVPEELIAKLSVLKQGMDMDIGNFSQRVLAAYLEAGHLPAHLHKIRQVYRRRRDAMLAALERHFPPGTSWTRPQGGLYIWVELPRGCDTMELFEHTVRRQRVTFTPGCGFAASEDREARHGLRLCFANAREPQIEDAVARLGSEVRRHLAVRRLS